MTTCACTARSRIETGRRETQGKKHRGKRTGHKKRIKTRREKNKSTQEHIGEHRTWTHQKTALQSWGCLFFACVS